MTQHEKNPDQSSIVSYTDPGTNGMPDEQGLLHVAQHVIENHTNAINSKFFADEFASHTVAIMQGTVSIEELPHNPDVVPTPESDPIGYIVKTRKSLNMLNGEINQNPPLW